MFAAAAAAGVCDDVDAAGTVGACAAAAAAVEALVAVGAAVAVVDGAVVAAGAAVGAGVAVGAAVAAGSELEFAIAAGVAAGVEGVVELLEVGAVPDVTGVNEPAGAKLLGVEPVLAAELPVTGWF